MKLVIPTRALILLMGIGLVDLITTAILHAQGRIVELNPLMRVFIERSEMLFVVVKGATLLFAWIALAWYARQNLDFVRKACLYGSAAYTGIWLIWFLGSL